MAQGNFTWQRGDITGDIYFDHIRPRKGEPIPFLRLYLMVDGSRDAKPIKGLRIMVYGGLAELVYGHVQKGSRIGVEGHIQLRYRPNNPTPVFEIVAERVEFIRNIDFERGSQVIAEMRQRGAQSNLSGADMDAFESALQPVGGELDDSAVE
jgi:single-stranded DNA-binding protein